MNRLALLTLAVVPSLFGATPVIFYSDLNSGPATGGENNLGVYVTITGRRFGATQGASTITLGGGAVTVKSWSDSRIVFQPGPAGVTGPISVAVGGTPSVCVEAGNCDFAVRPGNIYCISNQGSNSNNGKFTSESGGTGCWKTLAYSIPRLNAGDTMYFGAGATDTYQQEPLDIVGGKSFFSRGDIYLITTLGVHNGTAANPIAIVGYPGNSATIGGPDGTKYPMQAIQSYHINYWTVANLTLIGSNYAVNNGNVVALTGKGHRFVNLDIQLPMAPQSYEGALNPNLTGAVEGEGIVNRFYGLYIHNVNIGGTPGDTTGEASKHSALIYQGTDGNEQEFAWSVFDGTPQNGLGGINRCYHNHSSPGTSTGNPIWGVHFHDNILRGCPGNTLDATVDPGRGSGVEFYNNIIYHTGTCENWVGYTRGYSVFLFTLSSQADYNWLPQSGKVKFYNNTIYDLNSCSAGMSNGLFDGPTGMGWGSTLSAPPPTVTLCSSRCTNTRYHGTLPPTSYTPYYFAKGVAFQVGSSYLPATTQNVVDDGNGNLTQEGQKIGTIAYATGEYDFTLLRAPASGSIAKYYSIWSYRVDVKNNVIYLKSGAPVFHTYNAGQQIFEMDHNLFYNEAGTGAGLQPTWPIKVTNPVGNNVDPMFVSSGTGDFHLKAGSPAIGAGVDTGIAYDFDGNLRTGYDLGALAASSTSSVSSASDPCDLNGDGKVDQNDFYSAISQTIGSAPCGTAARLGTQGCNVAAVQRVANATKAGGCVSK